MIGRYIMKDLIKAIRFAANMNQEQFAGALGTTPLSINRWENGKTLPNRMAQTQLYNFCKEHNISVYDLIIDKIKSEAASVKLEEGRVLFPYRSPCRSHTSRGSWEQCRQRFPTLSRGRAEHVLPLI